MAFLVLFRQISLFDKLCIYFPITISCLHHTREKVWIAVKRWCWFPHHPSSPPDSPPRHWSALVSGQWDAALWLVETGHFRASDWCGQWSAGQSWPPAGRHWSAVTTGRDGQTSPPFPNPTNPLHSSLLYPPPPTFFFSLGHLKTNTNI